MKKDKYIVYVTGFSPMFMDVKWDKVKKYNKKNNLYNISTLGMAVDSSKIVMETDDVYKAMNLCGVIHSLRMCIGNLYAGLNELRRMKQCKK